MKISIKGFLPSFLKPVSVLVFVILLLLAVIAIGGYKYQKQQQKVQHIQIQLTDTQKQLSQAKNRISDLEFDQIRSEIKASKQTTTSTYTPTETRLHTVCTPIGDTYFCN